MKPRWHTGVPPTKAVAAHESNHPRKDGVTLFDIAVSFENEDGSFTHSYVACNPTSFGNWIVNYPNSTMANEAPSITRLKVVDGVVYEALGFTTWHPLSLKLKRWDWAKGARFFPVSDSGLPIGYEKEFFKI